MPKRVSVLIMQLLDFVIIYNQLENDIDFVRYDKATILGTSLACCL